MSVPYRIIECDRCGIVATDLVTAGFFAWTDGHGMCWMNRQTALCDDCETVVAMEILPEEDYDFSPRPPRVYLPRLFGRWAKADEKAAPSLAELRAGRAVADAIIALHRAPVCLSCGGDHITPLPLPRFEYWNMSKIYPLGPRHPGCGGGLAVRSSDAERVAPISTMRLYDIHGQQVEERAEGRRFVRRGYTPPR